VSGLSIPQVGQMSTDPVNAGVITGGTGAGGADGAGGVGRGGAPAPRGGAPAPVSSTTSPCHSRNAPHEPQNWSSAAFDAPQLRQMIVGSDI
ncbi:MAG TPA: hypothetical protein VK871_04590, partial [Candidatus Limnocylindrales bacterium]|nr:hypothetical protein [Candidatus Limnocylindrales bacterium]